MGVALGALTCIPMHAAHVRAMHAYSGSSSLLTASICMLSRRCLLETRFSNKPLFRPSLCLSFALSDIPTIRLLPPSWQGGGELIISPHMFPVLPSDHQRHHQR